MTPTCSSLNTSLFTTFLIASLSHLWCCLDDLWSGSIRMQWVHKLGVDPLSSPIGSTWWQTSTSIGLQQASESHSLLAYIDENWRTLLFVEEGLLRPRRQRFRLKKRMLRFLFFIELEVDARICFLGEVNGIFFRDRLSKIPLVLCSLPPPLGLAPV